MLASRAPRLLSRSPSLLRQMSNIYLLPVDPSAPSAPAAAPVDAAKLWQSTPSAKSKPAKVGTTHVFYGDKITALSSLGDKFEKKKGDERREVVRKAVAGGVKTVRALGESVEGSNVVVDASVDPHAVGTSQILTETPYANCARKRSVRTSRSTTSRSRPSPRPRSTPVSPSPYQTSSPSLPSRLPQTGT